MDIFRPQMLATGCVCEADFDVIAETAEDPTFVGGIPIICGAWARKPEGWKRPS